jgi:hypothetical protein
MLAEQFLSCYEAQTLETVKAFQSWAKRRGLKVNRSLQSAMAEYAAQPIENRWHCDRTVSTLCAWHGTGKWAGGKAVLGVYQGSKKFEVLSAATHIDYRRNDAYFTDLTYRDLYLSKLAQVRDALNNDALDSLFSG